MELRHMRHMCRRVARAFLELCFRLHRVDERSFSTCFWPAIPFGNKERTVPGHSEAGRGGRLRALGYFGGKQLLGRDTLRERLFGSRYGIGPSPRPVFRGDISLAFFAFRSRSCTGPWQRVADPGGTWLGFFP